MSKIIKKAMDEWLTTEGLKNAEKHLITTLRNTADKGKDVFLAECQFFRDYMSDTIISAVSKARQQGKCKDRPNA